MSKKLNLNKIYFTSSRDVIKKIGKAVEGVYLGGSIPSESYDIFSVTDIDLHFLLNTDNLMRLNVDFEITTNRYGSKIKIPNLNPIIVQNGLIIERLFLPFDILYSIEDLIKTHKSYAISTNLYRNPILYDKSGYLREVQQNIKNKFMNPHYVEFRLDYVLSLAIEKLNEFTLEDTYQTRSPCKALYDGPTWGIMSIGNLFLTYNGLGLTFRRHLQSVKNVLINIFDDEFFNVYKDLLDLWGFTKFSKNEILEAIEKLEQIYDLVLDMVKYSTIVNYEKRAYWVEGIKEMISNLYIYESLFPMLLCYLSIGKLMETISKNTEIQQIIFGFLTKMKWLPIENINIKNIYAAVKNNHALLIKMLHNS